MCGVDVFAGQRGRLTIGAKLVRDLHKFQWPA